MRHVKRLQTLNFMFHVPVTHVNKLVDNFFDDARRMQSADRVSNWLEKVKVFWNVNGNVQHQKIFFANSEREFIFVSDVGSDDVRHRPLKSNARF